MAKLYGIKNCDTVRKALKWFDAQGVEIGYHDFRDDGVEVLPIEAWADKVGLDKLINKRSTSYRGLTDEQKALTDSSDIVKLLKEHPTLIKRPVIEYEDGVTVGFAKAEQQYYTDKLA